jgi:hypothetical protein
MLITISCAPIFSASSLSSPRAPWAASMAELGRAGRSARYIVDKLQALADLLVGMGTTTAAPGQRPRRRARQGTGT